MPSKSNIYNYRPECGDGSHGGSRFVEELCDFLGPEGLTLDCGSGSGYKTIFIISKGINVVSIDIDILSLRNLAKDRPGSIICGDVQHLPFKDNIFDSIMCSEVLEHLPDPEMCINEIYRVTKKNGVGVFTTPVFNLNYKILVKQRTPLQAAGHVRAVCRHSKSNKFICLYASFSSGDP